MVVYLDLDKPENVQFQQLTSGIREYNVEIEALTGSPGVLISKLHDLCMPDGFGGLVDASSDSLAVLIRATIEPGKWKQVMNPETGEKEAVWKEEPAIPRKLLQAYMDAKLWNGIPAVKGITRAPMITKEMETRWDPGYEATTGFWVVHDPEIKKDESLVLHPLFDIVKLFNQYALTDRRLVADALAAALTPLLTPAIPGAVPALIVSARKPGSGKTELAKMCSLMGNGGTSFTTWRGGSEFSKSVHSYVMEDTPVVIFDNVKAKIDSQDLESVITSRSITARKFYSQTTVTARSNTTWFFTANGAAASEDMVRRSILIMLDKDATPSIDPWDGSLSQWMVKNESALITYMCHMIEQWRIAGKHDGSLVDINFPQWARIVSGILEHSGVTGLFEARESVESEAVQTDEDDEVSVVDAIAAVMGGTDWTSADLWKTVNDPMSGLSDPNCNFLKKWLDSGGKLAAKDKPSLAIGHALRSVLGKQFDSSDIYLTSEIGRGRTRYYKCVTKSGDPVPEPVAPSVGSSAF